MPTDLGAWCSADVEIAGAGGGDGDCATAFHCDGGTEDGQVAQERLQGAAIGNTAEDAKPTAWKTLCMLRNLRIAMLVLQQQRFNLFGITRL